MGPRALSIFGKRPRLLRGNEPAEAVHKTYGKGVGAKVVANLSYPYLNYMRRAMKKPNILASTALATLLSAAYPIHAALVFDTMSGFDRSDSPGSVTEVDWFAQGFSSGPYDKLVSVTLDFDGGGSGQYFVRLYDVDNDKPGNLVYTLGTGNISDLTGPITIENPGGWTIIPYTDYYIVVGTGGGSFDWHRANGRYGSGPWPATSYKYTTDEGEHWTVEGSDVDHFRMSVEAVPEPSTWITGAFAGLVLVGGWARRKWLARCAENPVSGPNLEGRSN